MDNLKKVGDVVSSLVGWDDKQKLLSPTRRFIREGEVTEILVSMNVVEQPNGNSSGSGGSGNSTAHSSLVIGNTEKRSKTYWMILFNDLLLWTKNKKKFNKFKKMYYLSGLNLSLGNHEGKIGVAMTVISSTVIPNANGVNTPVTVKQTIIILPQPESIALTEEWLNDFITCRAEALEREEFSVVTKRKTFVHDELIKTVQSVAIADKSDPNKGKKATITGSFRKRLVKNHDDEPTNQQPTQLPQQPQTQQQQQQQPFPPQNSASSQQPPQKTFFNTLKKSFRAKAEDTPSTNSNPNNTSPTSSVTIPTTNAHSNNVNNVQTTTGAPKTMTDELKNVLLSKSMSKLPVQNSHSHSPNTHSVPSSNSQHSSHQDSNLSPVKHSSAPKMPPNTQNQTTPTKVSHAPVPISTPPSNPVNSNANANTPVRNRSTSNPPEQAKLQQPPGKSALTTSQNSRPPVPSKPLPPPPGSSSRSDSPDLQNVPPEKEKPPIPPKPARPLRPTTPTSNDSHSDTSNIKSPLSPNIRPRANTTAQHSRKS